MPSIAFDRFCAEVLLLYTPPHRRKATYYKMRQALREFGAMPGVTSTADISPGLVAAWLAAHPDRRPVTNAGLLRPFRAACSYGLSMGYMERTPWDFRRAWVDTADPDDDDDRAPKHRSVAQIAGILAHLRAEAAAGGWQEGRLHALGATYAYCGLRKMEALGLKIADVDLEGGLIVIRSRRRRRLKTRASAGRVGIPPALGAILAGWLPRCGSEWLFPTIDGRSPWTGGMPGRKPLDRIRDAAARAGVPGFTIASFRHSIASHSGRWGLSQLDLKALLRHTTIATQLHYLHEDADDLRETARRIRYEEE